MKAAAGAHRRPRLRRRLLHQRWLSRPWRCRCRPPQCRWRSRWNRGRMAPALGLHRHWRQPSRRGVTATAASAIAADPPLAAVPAMPLCRRRSCSNSRRNSGGHARRSQRWRRPCSRRHRRRRLVWAEAATQGSRQRSRGPRLLSTCLRCPSRCMASGPSPPLRAVVAAAVRGAAVPAPRGLRRSAA